MKELAEETTITLKIWNEIQVTFRALKLIPSLVKTFTSRLFYLHQLIRGDRAGVGEGCEFVPLKLAVEDIQVFCLPQQGGVVSCSLCCPAGLSRVTALKKAFQ